ncbi:hypothetical protein HELRODRAFT_158318 [Helobdella robusta]|uniref:Uncharacterized protein n=1 Tax=Helobdella robusta TaxID=6412 RepID=T1EMN2_HELRO|nr:hypothetical protein HELRODRAFT_158318 [Helobdella robusta]ESO11954.1 hypothetical protein HELRODRAFT_158318 [Helobdella robusta]
MKWSELKRLHLQLQKWTEAGSRRDECSTCDVIRVMQRCRTTIFCIIAFLVASRDNLIRCHAPGRMHANILESRQMFGVGCYGSWHPRRTMTNLTSKECGLAAARAADEKMKKYENALPSMEFLPICIEVLGPMDPSTLKFLKEICKTISVRSGESRELFFATNNISCLLQRFLRASTLRLRDENILVGFGITFRNHV